MDHMIKFLVVKLVLGLDAGQADGAMDGPWAVRGGLTTWEPPQEGHNQQPKSILRRAMPMPVGRTDGWRVMPRRTLRWHETSTTSIQIVKGCAGQ